MKKEKTKTSVNKTDPKRLKIFLTILVIALIVVVIAAITIDILNENGIILRSKKVKKSDDVYINGAMMTFYFWDCFNTSLENNESYYKMYGLTSSADIDKPDPLGNPWRKNFEKTAVQIADLYLTYAQYAYDNGITLSKESSEQVEKEVGKFKDKAVFYGLSTNKFLSRFYGKGVKEQDVRDAITLAYIAEEGFNAMYDSIEVTDEAVTAYFSENIKDFQRTDYCFFVTGKSGKDNLTDAEKEYYSAKAEYIKDSTSVDEFKERVAEYLREENDRLPFDSPERLSSSEVEDAIKDSIKNIVTEKSSYDESIEFHEWIFSDERIPGDTMINHKDPYGTYGVIFMITPIYIDPEWKEQATDEMLKAGIEKMIADIDAKYPATCEELVTQISNVTK